MARSQDRTAPHRMYDTLPSIYLTAFEFKCDGGVVVDVACIDIAIWDVRIDIEMFVCALF